MQENGPMGAVLISHCGRNPCLLISQNDTVTTRVRGAILLGLLINKVDQVTFLPTGVLWGTLSNSWTIFISSSSKDSRSWKKKGGGHLFAHKCTFSYFLLFLTLKEWGCRYLGAFVPHFFTWQHILEIALWQVTGFFLHVFYSCSTVHSMYILYSNTLVWLGPQEGFSTLQW